MLVDYYALDIAYKRNGSKEIQQEKYTYHQIPLIYSAQRHIINTIQRLMRREDIEIQAIWFTKRTIEVDTDDIKA